MKKIITLTGAKNSPVDTVALKLSRNENVDYILPYTDNVHADYDMGYHIVSKASLENMIETDYVLQVTRLNGHTYAHFKFQLVNDYNILIVDDYGLQQVEKNWNGKLSAVYVTGGETSDRVGVMFGQEYYNYIIVKDTDLDYLIEQIAADMMEI